VAFLIRRAALKFVLLRLYSIWLVNRLLSLGFINPTFRLLLSLKIGIKSFILSFLRAIAIEVPLTIERALKKAIAVAIIAAF
jgi:hypothetical protein